MTATLRKHTGPRVCGFCSSNNHEHCPRAVRNGNGAILPCECSQAYCGGQVIRCLACKNEEDGQVDPTTWSCIDRDACGDAVQVRLDRNPTIQLIREVENKRMSENTGTATATKAPKTPKEPTFCVCGCEGQTKGGKFLPGHDARFVKNLVAEALEGKRADDAIVKDMADRGTTEALQAKFTKSVGLARQEATRRAEAKAEAEKKAAEREAAEKAKAEAKQAAKDAEPEAKQEQAEAEAETTEVEGQPQAKPGRAKQKS
jgi:hypothetical protein